MHKKKDVPQKTLTGMIRVSQRGTGYFRLPKVVNKTGQKPAPTEAEIATNDLGTALHGDTVTVLLGKPGRFGPTAKVLEIIKRSKRGFAGELVKLKNEIVLKASDPRMYVQISIPEKFLNGGKLGDKVFVKIIRWTDMSQTPLGEVVKVLGRAGEHEAEMQGIILERGFDSSFPPDVERDAEKLKLEGIHDSEIKRRRDMRTVTTLTIDPADAKDFDDALSFRKLENGVIEVGIHIADVSHYVQPNTALDREALERATSVYLVDRTIPMLPEVLSNDLCSLNPGVDKLAMSAVFEIDMHGTVLKEWFGKTIINSDKRFSYEEAQHVLDAKAGPFYAELDTLNRIAKQLTNERISSGAILMESDEVKFRLDDTGKPIAVYIKQRGDTNKLIEEFMLLANKRVAAWGSHDKENRERVFIYRIHDEPDKEKIRMLKEYLKLLGYELREKNGRVAPHEFNKLFKELEGRAERDTIQSVVIRSMQKAIYSTKNLGHYGLAFEFYTHFTSPIRRYPDIVAHRLLQAYLEGIKIPRDQAAKYQQIAEHSSQREVEAADAERASVKYKQIEYMHERIGTIMDGIVTGLTEFGFYAAEITSRTEGMVRLRDMTEDYFTYDEKNFVLRGQKTGRMIRIGDKIRIKVISADVERQQVDYALVSDAA